MIVGKSAQSLDPRLRGDDDSAKPAPRGGTGPNRHFNESEDWSMVTPGPMVELSDTFCR